MKPEIRKDDLHWKRQAYSCIAREHLQKLKIKTFVHLM